MLDRLSRQELEAEDERFGVVAPVRLDDADDDVALLIELDARGFEHGVRLADAWRRAEEDRELAPDGLFLGRANALEELVGVGRARHDYISVGRPARD